MALLEVRGLVKAFAPKGRKDAEAATRAVDGVSFDIMPGRTVALVGESGAGKSTVSYLVLRLLEPDGGEIVLDGVDLRSLTDRELRLQRRYMQIVFQDPHSSLDPRVPIGRSVAEPLKVLSDLNRHDREARSTQMLDRVALGRDVAARYPHQLSGGQLQRVAIARALTLGPKLIVCDEAVSALDVSVQAQVLNLLRRIQEEDNISYLFVSHDLSVVEHVAHEVLVMQRGKVVESGETRTVFGSPTEEYTRELLAAIPVADPRARGDRSEHGVSDAKQPSGKTGRALSSERTVSATASA